MRGRPTDFQQRLVSWYRTHRRDLPWRVAKDALVGAAPDPYHVLISEAMLQQTQVATVKPYFVRFISELPTLTDLAAVDEQTVLRLWQGLGYYSRARNLQGTAKKIVTEFNGRVPRTIDELLTLPGIGRYTAGAIASLAYDMRAPILDGNVIRVIARLDRIEQDPRERRVRERLWQRAEEILPRAHCGDFNSALMELGATVCTPRSPKCLLCPVHEHCQAAAAGVQESIPPARATKVRPVEHRWTICIRHCDEYLLEQRPAKGRWASLWQFITVPANGKPLSAASVRQEIGLKTTKPKPLGAVSHGLTHRQYEFDVFVCDAREKPAVCNGRTVAWSSLRDLPGYPLPRPHLKIAEMLKIAGSTQ